ncbi:hypothetical protein [Mycobacterium sp. shizuoka-1]|nr:hypothetical protein [Mycobacterium sp. shizuoka-1]
MHAEPGFGIFGTPKSMRACAEGIRAAPVPHPLPGTTLRESLQEY